MIKHIVIWTMKEEATLEQKTEMKNRLEALDGKVSELRKIEVGIDDDSGTISLTSEFDSIDDLNAYQEHPDHQAVVGLVRTLVCSRIACDYTA
ncbi:Dabb family protein [Tichowtungia aerotolerans]|uniref:Dabb family protein n=1 Tax=Tichowtungia aerotolerans TaxID=2697043 RepID=A0A6P1M7P4_9BACT|nr:Dabb family protein [Tichowtungia aerotolerans]QHI70062.1 Dabb family protein [Tichowtungia aerotolerans]